MKFSAMIFFFLLFVGVFYAYVKLVPEEPLVTVQPSSLNMNEVESIEEIIPLLSMQENEEIKSISIRSKSIDKPVILRKKSDFWELEEPYRDSADPLMVEGLVSALKLSRVSKRMQSDKELSEYGLAEPELTLGVQTTEMPQMNYLDIGDLSPVSENRYAKWQTQAEIFLIDRRFKEAFAKEAFSFRHKGVIRHSLQNIQKIKLQTFYHTFEMKYDAGQWVWSEPITLLGENISAQKMGVFLSFLKGLYVKEFLEEKRPLLPDYGLDSPKGSIEIWTADGIKVEEIQIGQEVTNRDAFYVKRADRPFIFLVSREKINAIFGLLDQILQGNRKEEVGAKA